MKPAVGITLIAAGAFAATLIATLSSSPVTAGPKEDSIARGRYLVQTAACNDCHTPGYAERAGDVPESQWLTGDHIGWRGPWGTTYPPNLRLYFQRITEEDFIQDARSGRMRPPMPWFNLADMTDADLRAIHRYVRSLGAAGEPVPAYVPPGQEPLTAYFDFAPQPPKVANAGVN